MEYLNSIENICIAAQKIAIERIYIPISLRDKIVIINGKIIRL
jgi:hypothetical protein